ncbi:hypothetical protein AB0K43_29750 [Kitasatospora sp. NPDC049258]|uniref:hypothetical protein n=1 Tax=Kitasatospora sp. NPDC049258 TaxID=3155394 RepID=UPI003432F499
MPATDQRSLSAADERTEEDGYAEFGPTPGADPGEAETWEIVRVHCPSCDRPIALVGDEERLPLHAVLPTAWHPFSPAVCAGSGAPADDLAECDTPEHGGPDLAALLALPAELDWRTQPFSHAGPRRTVEHAPQVPAQRGAAARR